MLRYCRLPFFPFFTVSPFFSNFIYLCLSIYLSNYLTRSSSLSHSFSHSPSLSFSLSLLSPSLCNSFFPISVPDIHMQFLYHALSFHNMATRICTINYSIAIHLLVCRNITFLTNRLKFTLTQTSFKLYLIQL